MDRDPELNVFFPHLAQVREWGEKLCSICESVDMSSHFSHIGLAYSVLNLTHEIMRHAGLQDLGLRQDAEVDDEAKRAMLALRMRLYTLALTRRIDDEEEAKQLLESLRPEEDSTQRALQAFADWCRVYDLRARISRSLKCRGVHLYRK